MAGLQPFREVPVLKFLRRIWPAAVVFFFMGLIASGILYESEWYRTETGLEGPAVVRSPIGASSDLYGKFFKKIVHYRDEICWVEEPLNELQKKTCDQLTYRVKLQAG